ncbi:MAG TPA: family 16 glycoside hydrolase [Terriglobales bacterium]|nr:family 16 glycoside hydrolase [Terriglobales bacterium]
MQYLNRILSSAVIALLSAAAYAQTPVTTIEIDAKANGRTYEGIGAISAGASSRLLIDYPEPYRSQILDYLFKPNYGASLQHLKVEIGGDTNSTDGSEPSHMHTRDDLNFERGYEWWLMAEAKKRNPKIMLDSLAWGAPGWIGNGEYWSQDMADYVAKWIEGAKSKYGLHIDYTGTWNETWTQDSKEHDWIKLLRKTLDARGLSTKIVAPDPHASLREKMWNFIKYLQADPALASAVYAVGIHYPFAVPEKGQPSWARESGYRLWASEDSRNSGDWKGAVALVRKYNFAYIEGRMTKTEIWSPVSCYYDILAAPNSGLMKANTPWSGHYEVQPSIWATAHMTQFAQPGWKYLDNACGYLKGKGSFVTLVDSNERHYSVVLETGGAVTTQVLKLNLDDRLPAGKVHVWRSNASGAFVKLADVLPQNGIAEIRLEPDSMYSFTTTDGQSKGTAVPPVPSAFPFPYADDFEKYRVGGTPKYLSDLNGTFEVARCGQRKGQCLRQVIDKKPIVWWGIEPDPYTIVGDAQGRDYEVSSDVLLEGTGEATLLGRIDSGDVFQDMDGKPRWPSAYVFSIDQSGMWKLHSAQYKKPSVKLAAGKVEWNPHTWHTIRLILKGTMIRAVVDGVTVGAANDSSHKSGMAGIGTGWNVVQFDNIAIR